MSKKRMLVLTARFPYPLYGGDVLRIYRMCEVLQRSWSITLASICQSSQEMLQELPTENPFNEIHRFYLPRWRSYLKVCRALFFTRGSLQLAYYSCDEFQRLVNFLLSDHDAILCHLIRTAPYAKSFSGPALLELTDHLPLTYDRSNALEGKAVSLRRLIYRVERDRIDRAQNRVAQNFNLVTVVSDVDRQKFLDSSGLPENRVATFANGVLVSERHFVADRSTEKLVYIGNLAAMPNVDAVCYFIQSILPIILASRSSVVLKVIGRMDKRLVKRFAGHRAVEFVGTVSSLDAATSDCVIGLCPLRIGAGVQNKLLDYMSLGLPAVTTSIGAEGIMGIAGEHFLVADSSEEYASAVLSLLADSDLRRRIATAGRSLIENTYSWETQLRNLGDCFEKAARLPV